MTTTAWTLSHRWDDDHCGAPSDALKLPTWIKNTEDWHDLKDELEEAASYDEDDDRAAVARAILRDDEFRTLCAAYECDCASWAWDCDDDILRDEMTRTLTDVLSEKHGRMPAVLVWDERQEEYSLHAPWRAVPDRRDAQEIVRDILSTIGNHESDPTFAVEWDGVDTFRIEYLGGVGRATLLDDARRSVIETLSDGDTPESLVDAVLALADDEAQRIAETLDGLFSNSCLHGWDMAHDTQLQMILNRPRVITLIDLLYAADATLDGWECAALVGSLTDVEHAQWTRAAQLVIRAGRVVCDTLSAHDDWHEIVSLVAPLSDREWEITYALAANWAGTLDELLFCGALVTA